MAKGTVRRRSSAPGQNVVGLVQMTCDVKPERNLKKALARIGEAAKGGATIVCLQELFRSQYFCQKEDTALQASDAALAEKLDGTLTPCSRSAPTASTTTPPP